MSTISKPEILRIFKALHRSCQKTFRNDDEVLTGMRNAVNECFKNNKGETDPAVIKKAYDEAVQVEIEIRTQIIQVEEIEPGRHRMTIEPEHCFRDPPKRTRCCDEHDEKDSSAEKATTESR